MQRQFLNIISPSIVGLLFALATVCFVSADEPAGSQKEYAGRTLAEWREAMKDLSPGNPASKAAVPGLIEILEDREVPWFTRRQVASTLGRFGKLAPEAVPVLIEILEEPPTAEQSPRIWAGKALALYGPEARAATPRLVEILRNPKSPNIDRQVALEALAQIGGAHPRAIPAIVETLNLPPRAASDKEQAELDALRELAADAVGLVGNDAAIAVPVLLRCLNDPGESMRRKSVAALGKIGPPAQLAIPTLLETLAFDDSLAVRDAVETTLAGIGSAAVPALMHLLEDEDSELRQRAARSLGAMKSTAQPALAKLRELLKDREPQVQFIAAKSLWQITGKAEASVPVLVECLKAPDRQLRMQAFRVLTVELGPAASSARQPLAELMDHPEPAVRQAAQKALERLPESEGMHE